MKHVEEKAPLVLGHHAGVAQLLDVVDLRHPTHHLLTPEFPERLEVEMPKPLVPKPGLIISMSGAPEMQGRGAEPPPCEARTTGCTRG
jgi:hypothetical protein